jgi:hypothetical protein
MKYVNCFSTIKVSIYIHNYSHNKELAHEVAYVCDENGCFVREGKGK